MARTKILKKERFILLILFAVVILVAGSPASAFSASSGTSNSLHPGDPVSISVTGLLNGDIFNISFSSTDLVNTTADGFNISQFSMPFGLDGTTTLNVTGTNVNYLKMAVRPTSGAPFIEKSNSGGPVIALESNDAVHKKVYDLIEITGTPDIVGDPIGITLFANGTVTDTTGSGDLNFFFQGMSSGNIRVQIFDYLTKVFDQTFTVSTPAPAAFVGSDTGQTPAVVSGAYTVVDLTSQTGTTLNITASGGGINLGSSVTVTQYNDAPGVTEPSTSTFNLLGKYVTIESTDLSGSFSQINISIQYTDAEVAAAGITDPTTMRIYYFDGSTWTPVTPGGVDTTNKFVWGLTTHLSTYGILSAKPSSSPPSSAPSGGQTGGSGAAPQVVGVPYVPTVTAAVTTAPPTLPVVEVVTTAGTPATPIVSPSGSPAVTVSPTPTPLAPVAGIFGVILGAGIFLYLRRQR